MLYLAADRLFAAHDPGRGHPERPQRYAAVLEGLAIAGAADAARPLPERDATFDEIARVHHGPYVQELQRFCAAGGGAIDADTAAGAESWAAAIRAAGAGLAAIEALERGDASAAFCAVRPPGHHALPSRAMGFCLLNNIAIAAAALQGRGQKVLIIDWDAHHGNGTQDIFFADPDVAYVSMHEWPLYPGTGRIDDVGAGPGAGANVNFAFPAGTTGDAYLYAIDAVVAPLTERLQPDWVLVSAGYDAHRFDPLTGLGLSSGDFADLTARVAALAPPGRLILFLEGGYDLDALRDSVAATASTLLGEPVRPEPATGAGGTHGAGAAVVRAVADLHRPFFGA